MFLYILIPLLPLLSFVILGLFGHAIREKAHWIAIPAISLSFALSVLTTLKVAGGESVYADLYTWIDSGHFKVSIGFQIDRLTAVMLLLVTVVSALVNIYSIGYMRGDRGYARFFACVSLFSFSMLMLVMSNNFLQLYVFWEAVGLCSYLLISHWYERKSACDAATKAFVVNRIGDFSFGLGILLIFLTFGSLDYQTVFDQAAGHQGTVVNLLGWLGGHWEVGALTLIALLLFVGAMGKSAQLPLHVWLPDAMEGPTPISALIHAATMVTAGVFMLARTHVLYTLSPLAMAIVVIVGGMTAVFAAMIALTQMDIKRIVAYSTVSQLGYMVMACGVGAFSAGIFHLMTHGAFKALLFLTAGSVIHALNGEQDLRKMGGLKSSMPVTYWTFLIGAAALAGIFPFAGFFSKDAILLQAFHHGPLGASFALVGLVTVLLTAFYSFRIIFRVFHGEPTSLARHAHESPWSMTLPLVILAGLSVIVGWIPIMEFLAPVFGASGASAHAASGAIFLEAFSTMAALSGVALAFFLYIRHPEIPARLAQGALYRFSLHKGYVDEFYDRWIVQPTVNLASALWRQVDVWVIDGAVNGIARLTRDGASTLRRLQTGQLQHYALTMAVGAVLMMTYLFMF